MAEKGYQKHHIIFRSQGGLDFDLNYAYLTVEQHTGGKGVHNCREYDLKLKKELQDKLFQIFSSETYTLDQIIDLLKLKRNQAEKAFKRVAYTGAGYASNDIVKRLMGGKFY
ncbi:MAG: HNH endonuclease [Clostridium sp.]|nr:HNH endonuclease [Clostridium sp.]